MTGQEGIFPTKHLIADRDKLIKIAKADSSVLITGETGSGKEHIAKVLHLFSPRAGEPFTAINIAAIPETLIEPELFGYEKGAHSMARMTTKGLLEESHGGTLFLDEIGNLARHCQDKLLRAVETKQIRRVGGNKLIKIDVRLIYATSRSFEELFSKELFLKDLFYRISTHVYNTTPLRDQADEIIPLAKSFINSFCEKRGIPPLPLKRPDEEKLLDHSWPGNIRELMSCMKRWVDLDGEVKDIIPEIYSAVSKSSKQSGETSHVLGNFRNLDELIKHIEVKLIELAILNSSGNRDLAAKRLGILKNTMNQKISRAKKHKPSLWP